MTYKNILVGIDGSDRAKKALKVACSLASALSAKLHLVWIVNRDHAMISSFDVDEDFYHDRYLEIKKKLAPYIKKAKKVIPDATGEAIVGDAKVLLSRDIPKKYNVDLIVLGNTGLNSIEKLLIGSHTNFVIHDSSCDVLVVKK